MNFKIGDIIKSIGGDLCKVVSQRELIITHRHNLPLNEFNKENSGIGIVTIHSIPSNSVKVTEEELEDFRAKQKKYKCTT